MTETQVLDKIIELEGNCLLSGMCQHCPFRSKCLPEFLNIKTPSEEKRMNLALSVVTNIALSESTDISEYKWDDGK